MNNEKGFTLIEMLVVLLIISVLIIITIPNVTKHFASINNKGCDAYISMVQAQVEAYKIDHSVYPSRDELINLRYVKGETGKDLTCPNGKKIYIDTTTGLVYEEGNNPSELEDDDESTRENL